MDYTIRELKPSEAHLLEDFTYEAIFQRDPDNLIPREVLKQPEIRIFYENFGKAGDLCFVAELDGKPIGAVWTRILDGEVKGFGHLDSETPEFGISLYKAHRGKGIGTALMRRILDTLGAHGCRKTSLAVQKDNYAVQLYQKVGFSVVKETEEEYLMVCILDQGHEMKELL